MASFFFHLVALTSVLASALVPVSLQAEHEVFYRYTVLGYVKDARGHPVKGREVRLVREKTGFSYLGQTDHTGLYVVILRLGDESAGEAVTVSTGEAIRTRVRAWRTPRFLRVPIVRSTWWTS